MTHLVRSRASSRYVPRRSIASTGGERQAGYNRRSSVDAVSLVLVQAADGRRDSEVTMTQDGGQRRMKIGVIAQLGERTVYDTVQQFSDIKALALAAEVVGLDSFWLTDHLVYRPHEPDQLGCWEVFIFLS